MKLHEWQAQRRERNAIAADMERLLIQHEKPEFAYGTRVRDVRNHKRVGSVVFRLDSGDYAVRWDGEEWRETLMGRAHLEPVPKQR